MILIDIDVGNSNFILFPIKTSQISVNEYFEFFVIYNDTALSYESQDIEMSGFQINHFKAFWFIYNTQYPFTRTLNGII